MQQAHARDERAGKSGKASWRSWMSEIPPTKVLVADDEPEMRKLLTQALREDGYEVIEAKDGLDLLGKIDLEFVDNNANAIIDLIVTDVRMPGVTGMEVLEGLRHIDWATPVIIISAFASPEMIRDAKLFGAAAILPKPFALQDFLDAVHNVAPPRQV
jgi:CheY-like chemotaxis protein